jgi:hypothetical protein
MGCDSHFFLERRVNNGPWHLDPGHKFLEDPRDGGVHPLEIPSLSGRSYYLFGLIAGVRSYDVTPIAQPRGLPNDVSKEILSYFTDYKPDFHTPTYLTPKELEKALNKYYKYIRKAHPETDELYLSSLIDAPAEDAFRYNTRLSDDFIRINSSIIKYIRSHLDWEKVENKLLGAKNKTEYRIIVWFDS